MGLSSFFEKVYKKTSQMKGVCWVVFLSDFPLPLKFNFLIYFHLSVDFLLLVSSSQTDQDAIIFSTELCLCIFSRSIVCICVSLLQDILLYAQIYLLVLVLVFPCFSFYNYNVSSSSDINSLVLFSLKNKFGYPMPFWFPDISQSVQLYLLNPLISSENSVILPKIKLRETWD